MVRTEGSDAAPIEQAADPDADAPRTRHRDAIPWILAGVCLTWSLVFIHLGLQRHDRFGTFGFDLGIYDQAIWLLSRFHEPFITIRGLNFFGHHVNPILLLLVPFYWFGGGPHLLLVVQVAAQASGAVAVYLLARDLFGGARWPALALAPVILLHPSYQFMTWEFFHPDALAVAPVLFAYWAARTRRWRWFALSALVAVACKEDVALAMAVMGLLIAARGDRRIGLVVAALSTAWFFVATRVIIPAANGIGPFYDTFFGEFGNSPGAVATRMLTHPGQVLDVVTRRDRLDYYRMMLSPFAFLPLVALPTFLIGAPMLAINTVSSFPYVREIKYHYAALVLAAAVLATVEAIALLGRTPTIRAFLIGLVTATSLAATVAWGPSPVSTQYRMGYWPLQPDSRAGAKAAAVALVPKGAAATVHYQYAPHMTHRTKIYEWPVPWKDVNWGVRGEHLDDPAGVQWILLDRRILSPEDTALLDSLLAGQFAVRYDHQDIMVAQRIRPPDAPPAAAAPGTG
ncbi:MAG: DUF2079 domain-containing protein [Acidimicrobiales bacterium]